MFALAADDESVNFQYLFARLERGVLPDKIEAELASRTEPITETDVEEAALFFFNDRLNYLKMRYGVTPKAN
jgi:hypothetical protein